MTAAAPLVGLSGVHKRFVAGDDVLSRVLHKTGLGPAPRINRAVIDADLAIQKGEVVALVGESGCGKSTLGRLAAGLLAPNKGTVRFSGQPFSKSVRLAVQVVFQDPLSSLNGRKRVGRIIAEAPSAHGLVERSNLDEFIRQQLQRVGLDEQYKDRFPHQLSGGQRQRVAIARALAVGPRLLICDEAIAALDVSIQAQILNLLRELRQTLGLTFLFITHDLDAVRYISDRIYVMYLGRMVESGPTGAIMAKPFHPYTAALIDAAPRIDRRRRDHKGLGGEIPSPFNPPPGCLFHPRCPHVMARCKTDTPKLRSPNGGKRQVACHLDADQMPA